MFVIKKQKFIIPTPDNKSSLNKAAVWATISTSSTYMHMAEFLSILDIPCVSGNSFFTIQRELGEVNIVYYKKSAFSWIVIASQAWQNCLWKNLEEAGKAEYLVAIERGHIDGDGIPYITVYVDGKWS